MRLARPYIIVCSSAAAAELRARPGWSSSPPGPYEPRIAASGSTGAGCRSGTRFMVIVPSSGSPGREVSACCGQGAGEFRLDQASE
ncbi:hypothetical protein ACFQE7_39120 [Nonomuraea ferruginea]|uniref:hypothetical protein n=1 Tax=Nonomuraea ferruginea TaxID=46174 RepID=UPI00361B9D4E